MFSIGSVILQHTLKLFCFSIMFQHNAIRNVFPKETFYYDNCEKSIYFGVITYKTYPGDICPLGFHHKVCLSQVLTKSKIIRYQFCPFSPCFFSSPLSSFFVDVTLNQSWFTCAAADQRSDTSSSWLDLNPLAGQQHSFDKEKKGEPSFLHKISCGQGQNNVWDVAKRARKRWTISSN